MKASFHLLWRFMFATALVTITTAAQAPGYIKIALVIGNSTYPTAPLANPSNDAKAMGEALQGLGFKVIQITNGNKAQMSAGVVKVKESLQGNGGVGMLYYAGHGLQMDARNYMVPVDAKLQTAADIPQQTVDVNSVIDAFKNAGNRMNILVLDACRNNHFGGINTGNGLAPMDAPSGTFLAYATAPGNTANDGDDKSGHGLYTQFLLQELKRPNAPIEDVFKRVRFAVRKASNNRQIPWESTSLEEDFQFNNGNIVAIVPATTEQLSAEFALEKQEWDRIKNSTNPDDFYAFLQKYPSGTITEAVHSRLNQLTKPSLLVQEVGNNRPQAYTQSKFHLGDVYEERTKITYRGAANGQGFASLMRVVKVEPNRIEIMSESKEINFNSLIVYDSNGGLIESGDTHYDPPQSEVPGGLLQVGINWSSTFKLTSGDNNSPRTVTNTTRIVACEQINVPAGSFNAFRIEVSTNLMSSDAKALIGTRWMVPELPMAVKTENVDVLPDGSKHVNFTTELVSIVRGEGCKPTTGNRDFTATSTCL